MSAYAAFDKISGDVLPVFEEGVALGVRNG
jgi:hypothetical protein